MDGLLRVAFGVNIHRLYGDIVPDVVDGPLDEGVEPFDVYDEQIPCGQFFDHQIIHWIMKKKNEVSQVIRSC